MRPLVLALFVAALGDEWGFTAHEAAHVQQPELERPPRVLRELVTWARGAGVDVVLPTDAFPAPGVPQGIARRFCESRGRCDWREYQEVVTAILEPFSASFSHGHFQGIVGFDHWKREPAPEECAVVDGPPTAAAFLDAVKASRPTIYRGAVRHWPAVDKWTSAYLAEKLAGASFSVAAAPHNHFDCVEDAALWGGKPTDEKILARPAQRSMSAPELLGKLPNASSGGLYVEYFPVAAMTRGLGPAAAAEVRADLGAIFAGDLAFADFLVPETRLLWLGNGGTVSALHFDRNENLMAVVRGGKRFSLFDPTQGPFLGQNEPLRQAHYTYGADGSLIRDPASVDRDVAPNAQSVYAAVNVSAPDLARFPDFPKARRTVCDAAPGDVVYVPTHWWHFVESRPDADGKALAVNVFYRTWLHKFGHRADGEHFIRNEHYAHLDGAAADASPCADDARLVCFGDARRR